MYLEKKIFNPHLSAAPAIVKKYYGHFPDSLLISSMPFNKAFEKLLTILYGRPSRYKKGDTVHPVGGHHLMVVVEVHTSRYLDEPLVKCQWSSPGSDIIETRFFKDSLLQPFNWYASL